MLRHRPSRLACIGGKCPTKGRSLLSLRHSELECYLVVVRAIQHDRNKGNREAGPTESKTCACGGCQVARPGATTVYELPSEFRNCSPTGEQFAANDRGMSLGHAPVAFTP